MFAHTAVGEGDVLVRHHEAVGRGFLFPLFGDLFGCQPPAGAGIDDVAVRGMGRTGGMELAAGAEAGIDKPHGFQLFVALGVDAAALALVIWLMGAALAAASSQKRPSHPRSSSSWSAYLRGQRSASRSSMRRTIRPPRLLALSHARRLHARLPRWSRPLGLGANRPTTALTGPASTPRPSAGRWGCYNTLPRPLPCTRRRRSLPSPWRSAWPADPDRCPP